MTAPKPPPEVVRMLANLTAQFAKYGVRDERHPDDPERKADEAPEAK